MATKKEIRARILKAINAKTGKSPVCPICGHNVWSLGSGYVAISAEKHPVDQTTGGKVFPLVPLLCTYCGNTHLLNLFYLGFTVDDWDSLELTGDG